MGVRVIWESDLTELFECVNRRTYNPYTTCKLLVPCFLAAKEVELVGVTYNSRRFIRNDRMLNMHVKDTNEEEVGT